MSSFRARHYWPYIGAIVGKRFHWLLQLIQSSEGSSILELFGIKQYYFFPKNNIKTEPLLQSSERANLVNHLKRPWKRGAALSTKSPPSPFRFVLRHLRKGLPRRRRCPVGIFADEGRTLCNIKNTWKWLTTLCYCFWFLRTVFLRGCRGPLKGHAETCMNRDCNHMRHMEIRAWVPKSPEEVKAPLAVAWKGSNWGFLGAFCPGCFCHKELEDRKRIDKNTGIFCNQGL